MHQKIRLLFVSDQTNVTSKEKAESQVLKHTAEKFQNSFKFTLQHQFPNSAQDMFPEGVNIL